MSKAEVLKIIERVRATEFAPRMKNVTGSYRFDVEGVGSWRVDVDHGRLAIAESSESADCVIHLDGDDFTRVMTGAQNMITAWMQGRMEVEGDLALVQKLHGILPRRAGSES